MPTPLNKEARTNKRLTQRKLAEMLGVHTESISEWENGKRPIPSDMLIKYAKICNVSTDFLLGITKCKSVENAYIHEKIGLNEESISMLEKHVICGDKGKILALDFLLRKNHTKAIPPQFSGSETDGASDLGLLNLITHYLIDDNNSGVNGLPCITSIIGSGSSLQLDGKHLTKGVILNLITEKLIEYKNELSHSRKRKKKE